MLFFGDVFARVVFFNVFLVGFLALVDVFFDLCLADFCVRVAFFDLCLVRFLAMAVIFIL